MATTTSAHAYGYGPATSFSPVPIIHLPSNLPRTPNKPRQSCTPGGQDWTLQMSFSKTVLSTMWLSSVKRQGSTIAPSSSSPMHLFVHVLWNIVPFLISCHSCCKILTVLIWHHCFGEAVLKIIATGKEVPTMTSFLLVVPVHVTCSTGHQKTLPSEASHCSEQSWAHL